MNHDLFLQARVEARRSDLSTEAADTRNRRFARKGRHRRGRRAPVPAAVAPPRRVSAAADAASSPA
jgi:hypothetical protein